MVVKWADAHRNRAVLKLNRDLVPLPAFLESLVDMFRGQAAAKGLDFVWDPPANLPAYVRTDEKRLRQFSSTCCRMRSNTRRIGEAITLAVRTAAWSPNSASAIPASALDDAELSRIFEPFERGSSAQARAQPGTGLGLAITRMLAQVMGGDVSAHQHAGRGQRLRCG